MPRRTFARTAGATCLAMTASLLGTSSNAGAAVPKPPAQVVVRVDQSDGYTIADVEAHYPVQEIAPLLGTRGIYLVESTSLKYTNDPGSAQSLADAISHSAAVIYAEPNYQTELDGSQFHAWPDGKPQVSETYSSWRHQQAATALDLATVHDQSQGAGITIAILDTGAAPRQPALKGHLAAGWNYIEDNSNTADVVDHPTSDVHPNGAVGHGTFVSGLALLVAPQATILPERVLDSDGQGNIFIVAQAILDAVNSGANVINLSLGTATPIPSHLLADALQYATQHGVIIVAAAGNDYNNKPHFPAASPGVTGVGALNSSFSGLSNFSDFGSWVKIAAPGTDVTGPLPNLQFAQWQGTSMATPFVAGEAAVIRSAYPQVKSSDVINAINSSAQHMADTQIGHGRINILGALKAAAAKVPQPKP